MTSIEPDPTQVIYASSHHHIVDTIQNLMRHVTTASFDVTVLNGIIGLGLDEDADITEAAVAMHSALRPGGLAVIGYNLGISSCCRQFDPYFTSSELGSLPARAEMTNSPMHHVYALYRKQS